jgi:SAM-dependent methyltransferase
VQDRERVALARQTVLWRVVTQALEQVRSPNRPAQVLDCGGGSGRFAVPLALATLYRRAAEAQVGTSITAVQGEVEALDQVVAPAAFDLVLAHAVLESVDSAERALTAVASAVRPGGLVSVLFDNPVAAVLSRVLAGDLGAALSELTDVPARVPLDLDRVTQLCQQVGLEVQATHGIEVFTEWLPGLVTAASSADEQLAELEEVASVRLPYRDLAARQHILARRPELDPTDRMPDQERGPREVS